jgi:L-rhamnose isomerase
MTYKELIEKAEEQIEAVRYADEVDMTMGLADQVNLLINSHTILKELVAKAKSVCNHNCQSYQDCADQVEDEVGQLSNEWYRN